MVVDVRSIIVGQLEGARDEVRANMASKGVNASGRTSSSLRVEDRGGSIVLVIGGDPTTYGRTAPLDTLEIGSRPGLRGDWFRSVIVQWTRDKGMTFENESHRWAVSTIIARNIEDEGTARYRNPIDVYSSVVEKTTSGIRSLIAADFRQALHTMIKSI